MKENSLGSETSASQMDERLFIGLMSGTSADSIDAVLISAVEDQISILETASHPIPPRLKKEIFALFQPGNNEVERMSKLDVNLGLEFANAALSICDKANISPDTVTAIGSHGQTIRHHPPIDKKTSGETTPFTLQIGDPNTLAAASGITTAADFRRKDIAFGGHGAPLAPGFHHYIFRDTSQTRVIANIGGMANITVLIPKTETLGYDTGPGNALMDSWILEHQGKNFDDEGLWASQGAINYSLLDTLLGDPYFRQNAPKSTGRERFNREWLAPKLAIHPRLSPKDVQATLCEATAKSIATEIVQSLSTAEKEASIGVYVCGGGAHNHHLTNRIERLLQTQCLTEQPLHHTYEVKTTEDLGIHPDWVEGAAFAWLAMRRIDMKPGNLPSVTGATSSTILGGLYLP